MPRYGAPTGPGCTIDYHRSRGSRIFTRLTVVLAIPEFRDGLTAKPGYRSREKAAMCWHVLQLPEMS
jgi:hypothetical protein